jgi:hypothetical protein
VTRARTVVTILAAMTAAMTSAMTAACHAAPFYEQTYLGAPYNRVFRDRYPAAEHLLNAFDYGHAILYETLITRNRDAEFALDGEQFRFITFSLLVHPPSVPLDEAAVGPHYVQLVPEVHAMFDWAHMLHRQLYDIWADPRIPEQLKDASVGDAVRYYKSRPDLAFSSRPKRMSLMEGAPYSLEFRKRCPTFNGLIWSYHWMQMAMYDGLIAGEDDWERAANIADVLWRFHAMLKSPPTGLPSVMPMTPAIAPRFAARYPEASIIFDNLHSLHDVVSDILASSVVPASKKRETILRAAAAYRDDTTAITTVAEWRDMAAMMGVARMGGVSFPQRK